jgi:SnoaL-like domain
MKQHTLAIRLGCSAALLVVLTACGLSSAQPTLPSSAPAPTTAPLPPESAPTTQPLAGLTESTAAVQVVLDYYHAIAQKHYDQAYGLWSEGGAASGQTRSEFKQGYANTAGLSVLLDRATVSGDAVTVPITILSVLNQSDQTQQPQRFTGTYTLRQDAGGWRIASANIAEGDASAEPPASTGDALLVVQAYYQAIDEGNYPRAYTYWERNGTASQQSYTVFVQGFTTTDSVTLATGQARTDAAAGSVYTEVPVVVFPQQRDGSRQSFCGTYRLRRANVPPFDTFGWRINSASTLQTPTIEPGSDTVQQLLNGRCAAR